MALEIVAHRGAHAQLPENTMAAFQEALDLGADAVELDVRLTRDGVLVVHHAVYVDRIAPSHPVFALTLEQLRSVSPSDSGEQIPTLFEVLEAFAGRIGLEIEIKGPELESASAIGNMLGGFRHAWDGIEVTSLEPGLLLTFRESCPGPATCLLFGRPEPWMGADATAHTACHRARLARARGVHLHPSQLSEPLVVAVRRRGFEVHAWDVNDEEAIRRVMEASVRRLCTDRLREALDFRSRGAAGRS